MTVFLEQNVAAGWAVYTDVLKSFTGLQEAGFRHVRRSRPRWIDLRKGAEHGVTGNYSGTGGIGQAGYPGTSLGGISRFSHRRRRDAAGCVPGRTMAI